MQFNLSFGFDFICTQLLCENSEREKQHSTLKELCCIEYVLVLHMFAFWFLALFKVCFVDYLIGLMMLVTIVFVCVSGNNNLLNLCLFTILH